MGLSLVGAMALVGYLLTGLADGGDTDLTSPLNDVADSGSSTLPTPLATGEPRSPGELALSTVQLAGLDSAGIPRCVGSGVVVDARGLILTNNHVVLATPECPLDKIAVAVTRDSSTEPEFLYEAKVIHNSLPSDLAVLEVLGPLDGSDTPIPPGEFIPAPLGDSDQVEIGANLRILGYPVIGGPTITMTTGLVSGFLPQVGVGPRALMKTDATIAAGNSGGMAIDERGVVIGIPTRARAHDEGPAVDCRPVMDTNGDGFVDRQDDCTSVGGFVNAIRPINFARPLLVLAGVSTETEPQPAGPEVDVSRIEFSNPRFTLTPPDEGGQVVETAPAGVSELCFTVDWSGVPDGAVIQRTWLVGEELFAWDQPEWNLGEDGTGLWLCAEPNDDAGLAPGLYTVSFSLVGSEITTLFTEGLEVVSEPVDVIEVTWVNRTGSEICDIRVNPPGISIGLNELPSGQTIEPDGTYTMPLPEGPVAVEARDCDGNRVAENYDLNVEPTDDSNPEALVARYALVPS